MKTKLKTSPETQEKTILKNRNFLNNQNYVISNFYKNYYINNFLILKYFSIVVNRYIWTVLLLIILYFLNIYYFKISFETFFGILWFLLVFVPFTFIPILLVLLFKNNKNLLKNISTKLNIFEISSPILSFKNIFIENKNGKYNLFKKMISYLFIVFIWFILWLMIFFIFDSLINFIIEWKANSSSGKSYIWYLFFPTLLSTIVFLYIKTNDFISRIRILPVLLFPFFIVIYIFNFIYNFFIKKLWYKVLVNKVWFDYKKIFFTELDYLYAKNNFIKITKK